MEGNYKKWINRINAKQDVLTEDNVGEFMDLELATKSTPSSGDTVLGRDSLTGKAVEIPTSSFGGSGNVDTSNLVPYTGATKNVNIGAFYYESSAGFKKTGGTSSQYLMADGSTSTLPTDLIKGTGAINYLTKITSSGTIGNSQILDDGTNVGIGTISTGHKLNVDGIINVNATPDSYGALIRLRNTVSLGTESFGGVNFTSSPGTDYAIGKYSTVEGVGLLQIRDQSGNVFMTINGVGNVGIGTTTPSEKLEVSGNVKATGFKILSGTSTQSLTANGGVFDLDTKADLVGGKIPASQLPAYVDDVLEFANFASFPATGESGKIYIAIDTNLTYRWGGSSYVVMSSSLALGETSSTAYRGDRGKIAYDHSQSTGNPHNTTKADIGLGNVENTSDLNKPISTATQNALNTKADIDDIPTKTSFTHNILVSNWTLVSGKYEAVISNAGILANSFVDVIPSNDNVDIVRSAQIYPSVLISAGSVKVYSKFLPSDTITVTININ